MTRHDHDDHGSHGSHGNMDDSPMWEDPHESSALRQLLRVGRVENSDYDVASGLDRHLAQLQAGAPMPPWAVQTTLQKSAGWSLLAWILPPMISAGVVGAWLAIRPAEPVALAAAAARQSAEAAAAPSGSNASAAAPTAPTAPTAMAQEPTPALATGLSQDRDTAEQDDRHGHRIVAAVRGVRQPARSLSSRRGRGARDDRDDNAAYASANTGRGAGTPTSIDSNSSGSSVAAAVSGQLSQANQVNQAIKPAASEEIAAKPEAAQEPAAEEPKAKEAKAKADRRSKDDESAQDEVTGARLEREMRMLAVAQRVLTDDPERSLRLCRQGESEFRGSMFSAERKQVALLALVQLGRVDQARREGIPFLRAYPNAPWSARLREALGSGHLPKP